MFIGIGLGLIPQAMTGSSVDALLGGNSLDNYGNAAFLFDVPLSTYRNGATQVGSFSSLTGLTFTRALASYAPNSAGVLQLFASGAPRITDRGLLIEGARTNKCTNYNAAPNGSLTNLTKSGDAAATLTEVDDTAALLAAGLQNICPSGKVFKLDNSAGSTLATVTVTGQVGNTNAHTASVYERGGTGRLGASSGDLSSNFGASTDYVRRVGTFTPTGTTRQLQVSADAGQIVYFILNQLEEASFVSSPIPVAGASATRPADVCSIAVSGITYPATLFAEFERLVDTGGAEVELLIGASDNDRACLLVSSADSADMIVTTGGAQQNSSTSVAGALAVGTVYRSAMRAAANDMRCARGGTLGSADVTGTMPATPDKIVIGAAYGGASPSFGFIKRAAVWNSAFTDSQIQGVTS